MAEITTVIHKKPAVESINVKLSRSEVYDLLYWVEEGRRHSFGAHADPNKYPVYKTLKDAVEGKTDVMATAVKVLRDAYKMPIF